MRDMLRGSELLAARAAAGFREIVWVQSVDICACERVVHCYLESRGRCAVREPVVLSALAS